MRCRRQVRPRSRPREEGEGDALGTTVPPPRGSGRPSWAFSKKRKKKRQGLLPVEGGLEKRGRRRAAPRSPLLRQERRFYVPR